MNFPTSQHSAPNTRPSIPHRLGLLGGSFNPIHNGHLAIAHQVYERLQCTRILFIPTGDPPHKQSGSLAPAQARLEMVTRAIAETPFYEVSPIEINRVGKSYSIDTVREVQSQYGPAWKLFFIIGLDAFLEFSSWRAPETLLRLCHFVVVPRPGQVFQSITKMPLLSNLDTQALRQLDLGAVDQVDIAIPDSSGLTCLDIPPCLISASEVRKRVQCGLPLANMLPPSVESYILQHRLYQEDRNRTHI
ncbi:MAG TPA: nicotinate-nucleotide adenylyltransferase [Nitrospira sp.]|nr:nicotinate-nucleotide adenylyltransferase [Nitrospira sp.]